MIGRIHLVRFTLLLGLLALASGGFGLQAADRKPRRERLQVSEVPGGLALPGMRQKTPADDSLGFLDERSSVSGVVAPYARPTPSALPSAKSAQKMLEKMDQQKNWMFQNRLADDSKEDKTEAEEVLSKDHDRSKVQKKDSFQRYMEEGDTASASSATNRPAADDPQDPERKTEGDRRYSSPLDRERGARTSPLDRKSGSRFMEDGRGNLATRSAFDAMRGGADGGTSAKVPGTPGTSPLERSASQLEFRKLLEAGSPSGTVADSFSQNPLGGILDPVNITPDLTRQAINPVTPGFAPDSASRLGARSILDGARGMNTAIAAPRSSTLFDPVARPLGPSSLSPTIFAAPRPVISASQPAVLEIPTRAR